MKQQINNNVEAFLSYNTIYFGSGVCYYNNSVCAVFAHKVSIFINGGTVLTNGELRRLNNNQLDCLLTIRGSGFSAEGKANAVEQLVDYSVKQL